MSENTNKKGFSGISDLASDLNNTKDSLNQEQQIQSQAINETQQNSTTQSQSNTSLVIGVIIIVAIIAAFSIINSESEVDRNARLAREAEQRQVELQKEEERAKAEAERLERIQLESAQKAAEEQAQREEAEKRRLKIKQIYDKYINNSLPTGSTPYYAYYGGNPTCNTYGCSKIVVRSSNSDVLVIIKNRNRVVRHAYIKSASSFTFSMPNGTYQPFFYYGKGWNPEKNMKNGEIRGGFIANEDFGKDSPQSLQNNILTYELILQTNGNFSTQPSNPSEAL